MADSAFVRYERIVLDNHNRFESLILRGELKPVFLWHALVLLIVPVIALLIPRQKCGRCMRPILFIVTLGISVDILRCRRVLLGANGYMVGLIIVWWLVWCSTLLFFNDAERDFRRVERVQPTAGTGTGRGEKGQPHDKEQERLVWQPYPQSIRRRIGWAFALILSMRGPEWTWRISSLDPLPPQLELKQQHAATKPACPNAKVRLRAAFIRFVVAYLAIDLLKILMILDPYFFGATTAPTPSPFDHLVAIPGLTRAYRLFMSGLGVFLALQYVTALNPIFFLGLSLAFPNASRTLFATPLNAPWLYTDQFGPLTAILDDGLAGTWGKWWHQIFRFGFTSTAKWLLPFLPQSLSTRRTTRRIITTLVAFGISGLMHSTGSYTQFGPTRPVRGPFLFFLLQAVGIFIQDIWCRAVVPRLRRYVSLPRWLCRVSNAVFVLAWLVLSGGGIADDFARGGLWLTEPLPFSLLRGFMGKGWVCWRSAWFEYFDDGSYWGRGVRIL